MSAKPGSMTTSGKPAPTFDENWRLLRQLWPAWTPTAETIRHVWVMAYDKPHGIEGPRTINQEALREAIIETARSNKWKEPTFYDINRAYIRIKNERSIERTKIKMRSKVTAEQLEIQEEHQRRMSKIATWSEDRVVAARNHVAKRFAAFRGYIKDFREWTPFYSGMIIAADEEIRS